MSFEVLNDFEFYSEVPVEIIEKYKNKIPPELLEIWQNYGFGTFANGYIKIINPDDYMEILETSYYASNVSIPIFVTGFADIITWEEGEYVGLIKYRKADVTLYQFNFNHFIAQFSASRFVIEFLDCSQYKEAIELLGKLGYNECFGYFPLLALGGDEEVSRLRKVDGAAHIDIASQTVGYLE